MTSELGIAFGIPSYFRTAVEHATLFPLVPLQILDGILSALVDTQVVAPSLISKIARVAIPVPCTKTWLPTLQKFLSHEWIDLEKVTDDAAKRDDAAAPVSLWNRRISLVLPCTDEDLDGWRRLLLQRHNLAFGRGFRKYMLEWTSMVRLGAPWSKIYDDSRGQRLTRCNGGGYKHKNKNKTAKTKQEQQQHISMISSKTSQWEAMLSESNIVPLGGIGTPDPR
jgi:hypothetical protein